MPVGSSLMEQSCEKTFYHHSYGYDLKKDFLQSYPTKLLWECIGFFEVPLNIENKIKAENVMKLADVMFKTSLCALGQSAKMPLETYFKL